MTLIVILTATLIAGIGSVWLAALLGFGVLARYTQHMLSMAAGALLATAFMHLPPEAFESHVSAHNLFLALLSGLIFFFLLDKAELWHHGHEHHHELSARADADAAGHAHSHGAGSHPHEHPAPAPGGAWTVLMGDSVHCFGDGVLIASAFIANMRLGAIAAMAVLAHEVPHHMGDLIVLQRGASNTQVALVKVSIAGAVTALGGLVGYWLVDRLQDYLPYFLVLASSSFIYVALADLIPQLQTRLSARQTVAQIAWLLAGMALVTWVSGLAHGH